MERSAIMALPGDTMDGLVYKWGMPSGIINGLMGFNGI
jgi:hypothetical protein